MNLAAQFLRADTPLRLSNAASRMLSEPGFDMATVMGIFHAALELASDDPRVLTNFAAALHQVPGKSGLMRSVCEHALELLRQSGLAPTPELLINMSLALHKCYQVDGACQYAVQALDAAERVGLDAAVLTHYRSNLADAHLRAGRPGDAIHWLTVVLEDPDTPSALRSRVHMARTAARIQIGDWDGAVADLERRFDYYNRTGNWLGHPGLRDAPNLWRGDGELLRGKRILVYLEQGLGDQIQHARLAQWLAREFRPEEITVACDAKLIALMRNLHGVGPLAVPDVDPIPDPSRYDYLVPVMSLIGERHRCGLHPLGDPARGYLRVVPARVPARVPALVPARVPARGYPNGYPNRNRFRAAVYWQGNPQNVVDWQRSCPLHYFFALAERLRERGLDIEWHSFQPYEPGTADEAFAGWPTGRIPIVDHWAHAPVGADMAWTAAQLHNMDLFIGIESGQLHLACAATHVTVIAVHTSAMDFRWFHAANLYGNQTAGVHHLRQRTPGDWGEVFERAAALAAELYSRRFSTPLTGANPLPLNPSAPEPAMAMGAGNPSESETLTSNSNSL